LRHLEKRLGLGLKKSRSRLEAKIEGLGKIWEGLVSVLKEKVPLTSLVLIFLTVCFIMRTQMLQWLGLYTHMLSWRC